MVGKYAQENVVAHYALFIKKLKVKPLRSTIALQMKNLAIGSAYQTEI